MKKIFLLTALIIGLNTFANKSIGETIFFEVIQNHDKVDIKWVSMSTCSNSFYVIERSTDGKAFEEVTRTQCAMQNGNYMEYFDTDYTPSEGVSYYRLKQITESNEEVIYSNATVNYIKTEAIDKSQISVSQNPSNTNELNVLLKGFEGKEVLVVLRDKKGNEFCSKVFLNAMPQYLAALDPEQNLPKGEYIITATANNKIYSKNVKVR